MAKNGEKWMQNNKKLTLMVQNRHIWHEMIQDGKKCYRAVMKMVINVHEMVRNGHKMMGIAVKLSQNAREHCMIRLSRSVRHLEILLIPVQIQLLRFVNMVWAPQL